MDLKTEISLLLTKCIMFTYDAITFPVHFIVMKPWKIWRKNNIVFAKQIIEGDPYSPCVRLAHNCINPVEGVKTMDELFRKSVMLYGARKYVGFREILSEAEEHCQNGKVFKKVLLADEYKWFSYFDIDRRVENLCKALLELGLKPKEQIIIFAETRIEWMLICQACFRINVPVGTLYATLGDDGIVHGINETEVKHVFTSQDLLPKLKKIIGKLPRVTNIFYMENIRSADTSGFPENVSIVSFSQLENIGNACNHPVSYDPPEPNDTAILMYTSGSTGIPKGVVLSHQNIVTTASGLVDCIPELGEKDVYLGVLPLAHSYEIAAEALFCSLGVRVGYSSPNTMTDKGTAIMPGCRGDASVLKPTIMCAVPLMADRIRKGVTEAMKGKSKFAERFFQFALKYKLFWHRKGFKTPLLNRIIFNKIKDTIGGRVRVIVCGGAPLSAETHEFIRIALDVRMLQAYGMTETAASSTLMALNDFSTGRVGAPLKHCYIRLVDWPEGNYYATDKPYPRGELVVGGDCVSSGYFKNEALTKESFSEENGIRWFDSGDIGELHPDGTLKIIDRKKDLVKLQFGEYVSLGKIEAELKTCQFIDNICIVGNSLHNFLVALVVPNIEQLKALALTHGKEDLPISTLCKEPLIITSFYNAILEQGQKSKLSRIEIPTKIKLCSEEWLPESGLVTASFKIRRKFIEQFYQNSIDEMYSSLNDITKST